MFNPLLSGVVSTGLSLVLGATVVKAVTIGVVVVGACVAINAVTSMALEKRVS